MIRAIIIADSSRARLFGSVGRHEPLRLIRAEDNPRGRETEQELRTDEPGRYRKGAHGALSGMEPHTAAHEVEAERFARRLADVLHKSLERGEFNSLSIAAPAHFLGLLRSALGPAVQQHLQTCLAKDLTKLEPHELLEHVGPTLWPGS